MIQQTILSSNHRIMVPQPSRFHARSTVGCSACLVCLLGKSVSFLPQCGVNYATQQPNQPSVKYPDTSTTKHPCYSVGV